MPKSQSQKRAFKDPRPKSDEVVPSWDVISGLKGSKLDSLVDDYLELDREIKALEEKKKVLKDAGILKLIKAQVKSVMVGNFKVTRVEGTSAGRLDRRELFRLGVSEKILDKATRPGTPWQTLKVTDTTREDEEE